MIIIIIIIIIIIKIVVVEQSVLKSKVVSAIINNIIISGWVLNWFFVRVKYVILCIGVHIGFPQEIATLTIISKAKLKLML
jgi:hypothetical protein